MGKGTGESEEDDSKVAEIADSLRGLTDKQTDALIRTLQKSKNQEKIPKQNYSKPSSAWYAVPFLFAILGGIIAYGSLSDKDSHMAENSLGIGLVMTLVYIVIVWVALFLPSL